MNPLNVFKLKPDYNNRVFGLDLMRTIAILTVVFVHASMLENVDTDFPWIRLIDGVELFFVLSGFLIGGIIIKDFQKKSTFGTKDVFRFWIRRWFRTLPNYFLILILNIIVVYFGIIKGDFSQFNWKFFLFLQNFTQPFYDFFWESWSLSIEEWFYILFPVILMAFYLIFKNRINKKNIFLFVVFIFLITPILLRFFIASKFEVDRFWLGVRVYKVVIYRLDGIAFGLLGAFIKYYYPKIWFKNRNIAFILGLILSYIILYSTWLPNEFSTKVYKLSLQSLGCFLLLSKLDSLKTAPRLLTRVVTHISLISYSMYLINSALVAQVIQANFPPQSTKTAWLLFGIYWVIVIVASTLLYKYYEKPMMDLRDKINTPKIQ